jgi:hypothetical protein
MWEGERQWDDYWGSIHEAAHAVVARRFGYDVQLVTMTCATIPFRYKRRFGFRRNDRRSLERLLVSCAGDAATTVFLGFTATGTEDDRRSLRRLRRLGAGFFRRRWLLRMGQEGAERLVQTLKPQILAFAKALREHRELTQDQLDEAMGRES